MDITDSNNLINLMISLCALFISLIALIYTIKIFLLKSGQKIRCDISICSTIDCEDTYISSIILENIKDKATVIFKIYLKIGRNNYLEIDDFSSDPLILKPFEVFYKEYDPLLFYADNMKIVRIDRALLEQRDRINIILSTTNGKYKVKGSTKRWDIIPYYFKNFATSIIKPIRLSYKERNYGSNIKYLLDFKFDDNHEDVIPIRDEDVNMKKFQNFYLTNEALKSKDNLEKFIESQKQKGNITYKNLKVIDFREEFNKTRNRYDNKEINIELLNFFEYNILGPIFTFIERKKMDIKNKKIKRKNKSKK